MNKLIFLFSFLLLIFCYVEAQSSSDPNNPLSQPMASNFQPTIGIVLLIMAIVFLLTILAAMYAKFCYRAVEFRDNLRIPDGFIRQSPRSSGIDKRVIESLPFFKFSALKGLRGGLECAVCLSKFEDIEVLRLLPKCKHAFHINCVDQWLENHSSCPLCRQRISIEDSMDSNSSRLLTSQSEVREDSIVELFVEREDSGRKGSSGISIGSSFRKFGKGVVKENQLPIREGCEVLVETSKCLHKFNHKIIMSNAVLKSRWSDLNSSDLLFLNSEMLGDVSSNRFTNVDSNTQGNPKTQATEEVRILSEDEMRTMNKSDFVMKCANTLIPMRNLHLNEKRSMSEIVVHSRFLEFNGMTSSVRESSSPENAAQEKRLKRLWLLIARKTIQWHVSRGQKAQQLNYTRQTVNVIYPKTANV